MKLLIEFVQQGGPVMAAILLLSVVLYARCCKLLVSLWRSRRVAQAQRAAFQRQPAVLRRFRAGLHDSFRHQRFALGAMVAAAPLLGLLGTVGGMSRTFHDLADPAGGSMSGLARGISEVLVATESGLAVAIPALLLIALAQRELQRQIRELGRWEAMAQEERAA